MSIRAMTARRLLLIGDAVLAASERATAVPFVAHELARAAARTYRSAATAALDGAPAAPPAPRSSTEQAVDVTARGVS